jgi:hypothetical protein
MRIYAFLLSCGYFFLPIVILILISWLLKSQPKILHTHLGLGAFSILTFGGMVGESNLAALLCLFSSAVIYSKKSNFSIFALTISNLILIRSYESMIFFGPYLIYLLIKFRREFIGFKFTGTFKYLPWFINFIIVMFATGYQTYWFLNPLIPGNRSGALNLHLLLSYPSTKIVLVLTLIILGASLISEKIWPLCLITIVLVTLIVCDCHALQITPAFQYLFRTVGSLMVFAGLCALFVGKNSWLSQKLVSKLKLFFMIWVVILGLCDVMLSVGFASYAGKIQQTSSRPGIHQFSEISASSDENLRFSWPWSTPTLSYDLCRDDKCGLIENQFKVSWTPFDPNSPPSRHGIYWFK